MNRLHNLRIRTQLLIAFGIILAVMIAQSVLVYRVAQINRDAGEWVEHTLRVIALADDARTGLVNMQTGYRGFLLTGEERYLEPYESGRATYQSRLDELRRETADNPQQMARWAEIDERAETWQREVTEPGIAMRRDGGEDAASIDDVISFAESDLDKQQFDEIRRVLGEAVAVEDQLLQGRSAESERATDQLQMGVVGGTIASVGLSVLVVLYLSRSIGGGITELATAARRMANGDFNARVATDRRDEIGVTGSAFDQMASRLQAVIAQLEQTAATAQVGEERIRAVVNGVGEGIITFGDNGVIDSINPAAEEIFGYDAEIVCGRVIVSLISPDAFPSLNSTGTNTIAQQEATGRHANGTSLALVCTTTTVTAGGQRRHIVVVRDVTAVRKAEAEMLRREQEFTALVERSTSPIVRFDRDGRYLYVNPAHERIVERPAGHIVGKRMDEVMRDAAYVQYWHENIRAVVTSREERTIEFPFTTSEGVRWFSARLFPEIGPSGSVESVLAISQEVTERKRMEETLRESEERFRSAFDAAPIGISLTTIEGRYIRVNAMMSAMLGYSEEELQSLDYQSITHPADREEQMRLVEELVNEEREIVQIEKRYLHRDGHPVYALLSVSAIRDAAGKPAYLVAQAIDMTSRKEAEAARDRLFRQIERARSEARAILDASSDVMILVAPQGTVLTVNRRFEDLLGIDSETVIGAQLGDLTEAVQRVFGTTERFNSLILQQASDPSRVFTDTIQQRWPTTRELELHSSPVQGADGEHLGRLFVLRDVTHQREVDRMKTEFVSLVSHELRTPLTSIKGYVDLLIDGEVGDVTDQQRAFLEIVGNNARRLVALINDLLDISRIESGKVDLNRTALDIASSIRSVVTSFAPQLSAKQQTIDVRLPDWLPTVWGDSDRVIQILTNLISNAHKYTPASGTVTVAARRAGSQVIVDVSDSGVGLEPEEVEKLFTKFYRAKNRATQQVGGTGLGLAITRSLVEMHGGEITVRSTPGEGSTFSFSLPVRSVTGTLDRRRLTTAAGGSVLVVDDEPDIANLIVRYLQRSGYHAEMVTDGHAALERARTMQPDLITLDIMLPDIDGYAILDALQHDPATRDIPVMLISMLPDEGEGTLRGAIDYLPKPVQERVLAERIQRVLASDRSGTILVADDDDDTRQYLAEQVRRAGYRVIEAVDGGQAAELARVHRPALALLDIRMPQVDGIEALRQLRGNDRTRDIPVIMMTVSPSASEENGPIISELGATLLADKALTAEDLAITIARELEARATS